MLLAAIERVHLIDSTLFHYQLLQLPLSCHAHSLYPMLAPCILCSLLVSYTSILYYYPSPLVTLMQPFNEWHLCCQGPGGIPFSKTIMKCKYASVSKSTFSIEVTSQQATLNIPKLWYIQRYTVRTFCLLLLSASDRMLILKYLLLLSVIFASDRMQVLLSTCDIYGIWSWKPRDWWWDDVYLWPAVTAKWYIASGFMITLRVFFSKFSCRVFDLMDVYFLPFWSSLWKMTTETVWSHRQTLSQTFELSHGFLAILTAHTGSLLLFTKTQRFDLLINFHDVAALGSLSCDLWRWHGITAYYAQSASYHVMCARAELEQRSLLKKTTRFYDVTDFLELFSCLWCSWHWIFIV